MTEHLNPEDFQEDLVPEDDAIIGRYLRWSLAVVAVVALIGGVVYWLLSREDGEEEETTIVTEAPVQVTRSATAPQVTFTDMTTRAGIGVVHESGAAGDKLLPETMGSGSAFLDFDRDGDQDLILLSGRSWQSSESRSRLFANDGNGNFTDVSDQTGFRVAAYATGIAVGDVDNDGWIDVFVTAVGANHLLHNKNGRFEDVTAAAGVAGANDSWSTSAAFVDIDGDGDLDLFVGNYVVWSPEIDRQIDFRLTGVGRAYGPPVNYEGTFSYLYLNQGGAGVPKFEDISAISGIQVTNPATGAPVGKVLGVAPVDVDEDGAIDLMIANDTVRNFFFHNQGDGIFTEDAELYGLAYGRAGEATGAMGIDAAYYRNNTELGFAIGNFANEMTSLYLSQGDPTLYADEAIPEGIGAPTRTLLSFGVLYLDYDLDGRLDILQANGHLEGEINTVDPSQTYEQPSQLFWNAGDDNDTSFIEVDTAASGDLAIPLVGRGGSFADIDGDGDLDVVLTQAGRRPLLLRNDQDLGHHWLRVQLVDPTGQRDAIGARVELESGGVTQRRQVMPTRGYQSQSELILTFGLGTEAQVDALRIVWPDGTEQETVVDAVDQLVVVERSAGLNG